MIQIITTLDEIFNHILNVSSLNHFIFHMKSFTHVISQKTCWMKFFIQTNITMLKKKVYWKNYFSLKDNKNNVRGFISTFILHVYQNAKWNQRKLDPKIIQNLLKINAFSCPKWTVHRVISPITSTKSSCFSHQIWFWKPH